MMTRRILIAAILAGPLPSAATAADLLDTHSSASRNGAFAGARLRVSLDREPREGLSAGLALAPTRHDVRSDGSVRLRISEGLKFGASERRAPGLSFAGRRLRDLSAPVGAEGERRNISTIGWVAIGVGVVAIGTAIWFFDAMGDASE